MPYSPLGRGFLTGEITSPADFAPGDFRRSNPRFQGEHFQGNLEVVAEVRRLAEEKRVTAGQLALAWLLAQGNDVVPIPGTQRRVNLEQNAAACAITLSPDDLERIEALATPMPTAAHRAPTGPAARREDRTMQAQEIETYLADLGQELHRMGVLQPVRLLLIGGAFMLTQLRSRRTTNDVDVLLKDIDDPTTSPLYQTFKAAVRAVASRNRLPVT